MSGDEKRIVAKCLEELANVLENADLEYDYVLRGKDEVRKIAIYPTIRAFVDKLRNRVKELTDQNVKE